MSMSNHTEIVENAALCTVEAFLLNENLSLFSITFLENYHSGLITLHITREFVLL